MASSTTEHFITNLIQARYTQSRSLSELSSFKSIFTSLESTLTNSIKFYKTQLEKSEFKNQSSIDNLTEIYQKLYEKFKSVSDDVMKRSEKEVQMQLEINSLKKQIETERKCFEELGQVNRKLEESVNLAERKLVEAIFKSAEEKSEIFKGYLEGIAEVNGKIGKKVSGDSEVKGVDYKNENVKEFKEVFPVVSADELTKYLRKSVFYKKKCKKLQSQYEELKNATDLLLTDIEHRAPELIAERDKYQELLTRYKILSQDFNEYKQKQYYSKEHLEILSKKSSESLKVIESQKFKISSLISDIFTLTSENHKLLTGSVIQPEASNKFIHCVEQNLNLTQELENLNKEFLYLQLEFKQKVGKVQDLTQLVMEKDREIEELKIRVDVVDQFLGDKQSALAQFEQLNLKQELEFKDSVLQDYKVKYSQCLQEILELNQRDKENMEEIKALNAKLMSQTQELFQLRVSKNTSNQQQDPKIVYKSYEGVHEKSLESRKKIEELLNEKLEFTLKIQEAYKEIQETRISWAEEVAKLQSDNDILRLVNNPQDTDKLRDELGTTKSYLREIRCLLNINEKELFEERTKRMHCEKALKRLRKAWKYNERNKMADFEIVDLSKKLEHSKDLIQKLNEKLESLQEKGKNTEEEYQKQLYLIREQLNYELKSNEIHKKNIVTLTTSFKEISEMLEKKKIECSHLESYLDEKKIQRLNIENLISGNIQGKEVHELCFLLHNRVESYLGLQDKDSFKSIYQIENLKLENAKLKEELSSILTTNKKQADELEKTKIQISTLADSLKKAEEIYKQPEILQKIVRLIHKSSKLPKNH